MNTVQKFAVLSFLGLVALGASVLEAQTLGSNGKVTVTPPERLRAPRADRDLPCRRQAPASRLLVVGGRQGVTPVEYQIHRSNPVPAWTDPFLVASVGIQF
jgi:hypothetical protein